MNNITWFDVSEKKVTDEQIQQLEQYLSIKFPNDFIECVKQYDGGYPHPKIFDIQGQDGSAFSYLLTLDSESKFSILRAYEGIKDRLVDKVYPFATDPYGNFLCFDYRNDHEIPTIVFWEHEEEEMEKAIFPVCSSFTELLNSLHDYDDEDE
ncbi:SMI1/KNR4 family protein [Bacillus sp. NPDC077411]|uniref:SMI1/KNR4 family protein n=1 Tax=Bacillus sp. NPDC077411 TaxID=3363947 RepID=UPI0037C5CD36